jgi:hypothetical protein
MLSFLGDPRELEELKKDLLETIEQIIDATKNDSFAALHEKVGQHICRFKYLE